MSSSNSFNTCPRCANSNSLNAKYCSRCGAQLKVPSEAVVCHKCHTRNSSLANFCRNCGATLKVGAQTKICPRCGREIGAEENMCACGYSFVTLQQTEPRRADVSSTNKDKKDKKRDKGRNNELARVQSAEVAPVNNQQKAEKKPKQKKSGRGFALFAFLFLAVFVVLLILPVNTRGPLAGFDKGIFRPNASEAPKASAYQAATLYADGDEEGTTDPSTEPSGSEEDPDPTPVEKFTVTFKNGEEIIKTFEVTKGEKLTAEQIPADLEIDGQEFLGWYFNDKILAEVGREITMNMTFEPMFRPSSTPTPNPNPNPTPDPEPTPNPNPDETETPATIENNVYGWDLIMKIVGLFSNETKAAMGEYEGGKFKYIVNEYFGTATFIVVVMFALFIVTAVFHLLVCIIRMISPRRSKHSNLLFLILAVCTTVLVILMFASQAIKADENAFKMFFAPMYNGLSCSYGYVIALIPIYYWFFWLYSCIAKKKMPKKTKKNAKSE